MNEIRHPGVLASQQQRVVAFECEAVEGRRPGRGQQDQPRGRVALGNKTVPRRMSMNRDACGIIEHRALQSPVVEHEAERLDQVDGDPEAGGEAPRYSGGYRVRIERAANRFFARASNYWRWHHRNAYSLRLGRRFMRQSVA